VAPENKAEFELLMKGTNFAAIGQVADTQTLEIYGLRGKKVINVSIDELKETWQKPLRW
jgi:hypothetical protein